MAHPSLVRSIRVAPPVTLLVVALLAAACGGDDSDKAEKVYTPPPTPKATPTAAAPDPASGEGIEGARAALQAFLRGQAAGDEAVCRYVAPDSPFFKGPPIGGDCAIGVKNMPHVLRPQERQALRTVVVTGGRLKGEEAVIPFSALHWTAGSMTEKTLQARFTLRRDEENWQIFR
ncbi:hypothetical protein [Actinomadura terrae]|uniref:hypothetical protein n=1 Tax=Actinomadura terrae TaxID=604353 RepID=UPI001FA80AFA|nr:hypothetical protein [Actinomadura terrae]